MSDLGFLIYLAGLLILVAGWMWRRWKTRGHPHWPMTEGTVESHRLEKSGDIRRWQVVYSYCALGDYYSGTFAPDLPWGATRFKSEDAVGDIINASYPVGTKFPLRFNPDEPEWSIPLSRRPFTNSPIFE